MKQYIKQVEAENSQHRAAAVVAEQKSEESSEVAGKRIVQLET